MIKLIFGAVLAGTLVVLSTIAVLRLIVGAPMLLALGLLFMAVGAISAYFEE